MMSMTAYHDDSKIVRSWYNILAYNPETRVVTKDQQSIDEITPKMHDFIKLIADTYHNGDTR